MEKLPSCPACDSTHSVPFLNCIDYTATKEQFAINQCVNCGLKFTNPRPNIHDIAVYYSSDSYISHSDTSEGLINSVYKKIRQYTVKQKVNLVNTYNSPGSTILDYGSGTGTFLHALNKGGYRGIGIEPSAQARMMTEHLYHIATYDLNKLQQLDAQSINTITMWHVLEHVHSLKQTLEQFRYLLKENGYLIIAVPNADSMDANHYKQYWAAYDVPRHLYHFNLDSMLQLMNSFNYKLIEVKPMLFDSTYVSVLSEQYKTSSNKTSVINMVKGTFWGMFSNVCGLINQRNYSSLIYIFKR